MPQSSGFSSALKTVLVAAAFGLSLTRFDGVSGQTVGVRTGTGSGPGTYGTPQTHTDFTATSGFGPGPIDLRSTLPEFKVPGVDGNASQQTSDEQTAEERAAAEARARAVRDETAQAALELRAFAQRSLDNVAILQKIQAVATP